MDVEYRIKLKKIMITEYVVFLIIIIQLITYD